VLESLAVTEVSVRARVTYQLGVSNDPFLHKNKKLFRDVSAWENWLKQIRDETDRSKEPFINHFKKTYAEYPDLPVWVLTELMSFGSLSKFYSELQGTYQRPIAWYYGVPHAILASWLHSLTHIRNLCAHHSRLWDRYFHVFPKVPRKIQKWDYFREQTVSRRTFFMLSIIKFLLDKIKEHTGMDIDWSNRIINLLDSRPFVPNFDKHIGLSADWKQMDLWR
jgi:abortive infection bacteriophage resistance protein